MTATSKPQAPSLSLTGKERTFAPDDIIVTKTDLGGRITYANDVFLSISALTEEQALGQPHSLIRHPHMPKCVFRLLWETIKDGREIFAYVLNRATTGDHYWVLAHVTPTFDAKGAVTGYHSNRRVPKPEVISGLIKPLYDQLYQIEQSHGGGPASIQHSMAVLNDTVRQKASDYESFIFSTNP
ncbi:PAS domain-containing protein [Lacibacterium aquatile]|uniref:PAS domain-containing protein n=1 Tax=Lacibacterium aquatile TaxID=1168082 RepID=A0ABW5DN73_9PROT